MVTVLVSSIKCTNMYTSEHLLSIFIPSNFHKMFTNDDYDLFVDIKEFTLIHIAQQWLPRSPLC